MAGENMSPRQNMHGSAMPMDEQGASDNRMSLNPNTFLDGEMANWEDNTMYVLDGVQVRQISPGEFEIVGVTSGKAQTDEAEQPAEEMGEGTGEEAGGGMPEQGGEASYPNPAVAKMMDEGQ